MRQILLFITAFTILNVIADGVLPSKINLLLVDVGTIDTVAKTEKFLAARDKVVLQAPPRPSAADSVVDPSLQKQAVRINWITGMAEYCKTRDEVAAENKRRREILEGLRNSIVGSKDNRMVVIAKDYLASGLEDYSDYITIVDRSDASLSEVEKAISNHDQEEVAPATLFLSVTMGDLQRVRKAMTIGDTVVQRDSYTRRATAKVSDFNNIRVFSCDVIAKHDNRRTDAVSIGGEDSAIAEALIEDAMKQIAKRVGEKFVKEFVVNVVLPTQYADNISVDSVELYLDRVVDSTGGTPVVVAEGTPITAGEPFKALAVNHTVSAVMSEDGYLVKPAKVTLGANRLKGTFRINVSKSK